MSNQPERGDRKHSHPASDQRNNFQRDRDRILYSDAFRRLQGVTQVVSPDEGYVFHNRLTHSMKVAQISRRIAEKLLAENSPDAIKEVGGIDPEVAEAAALAHDLGHPPFGHVAEEMLARLVRDHDVDDQYEGNAQTFRILTQLESRWEGTPGMNLTRATLNAVVKYPWYRQVTGKKSKKYGAYQATEAADFDFARGQEVPGSAIKSCEAEIMDWSDDIAFSVHDTEDFYRAGLIPLDRLSQDSDIRLRFLERVESRWKAQGREMGDWADYKSAFERIMGWLGGGFNEPYNDSREHQAQLRAFASVLIHSYISAIRINPTSNPSVSRVLIDRDLKCEVTILKELTWEYVILRPALATQQHGYETVIRRLFEYFYGALVAGEARNLPARFRHTAEEHGKMDDGTAARSAADVVSGLTDGEALQLFRTLSGIEPRSILNGMR